MNGAGDLEYLSNDLKLPHHASLHPCWLCAASRAAGTDCPITDSRVDAVWKGRLVPHGAGAAVHPSDRPIFSLPGCSRWCFIVICSIHIIWVLTGILWAPYFLTLSRITVGQDQQKLKLNSSGIW